MASNCALGPPFRLLFALASLLAASGCRMDCDAPYDHSGPLPTLKSFHRAFVCDDRDAEYACLSPRIKASFGGFPAYCVGREAIREDNPLALAFLGVADLEGRTTIDMLAGGNSALARIDVGSAEPLRISLVNWHEYRLYHADGKVTHGYAPSLEVEPERRGFAADVIDPDFEPASATAVQRAELMQRWLIDDFPGLDAAVAAAGGPGGRQP